MKPLIEKIKSLKDAFEHLERCVFIKDTEGLLFYMNPAFVRLTGYTYTQMLYESTEPFLKGNTGQIKRSLEDDWRLIRGETMQTERILYLRTANDEYTVVRLAKTALRHKDDVIGILGITEDITASMRIHFLNMEKMIDPLPPAERRILFLVSRGMKRKEIARMLKVSDSTVDSLWQRSRERLQLNEQDLDFFLRIYNDLIDNIYTD